MDDTRSNIDDLQQQRKAKQVFQVLAIGQIIVHLGAYLAAFIKLIMIEGGGYYDAGVIIFIGMTIVSMPLFAIGWWLFQRSFKLSKKHRLWGYIFDAIVAIWSIFLVKVSYFM
jgi:hypothetical protein